MAREFAELSACLDCLLVIANGYTDDMDDDRIAAVERGIGARGYLMAGDSEQDDEFSWLPCEVCGSRLGGSRHQVFEDVTP